MSLRCLFLIFFVFSHVPLHAGHDVERLVENYLNKKEIRDFDEKITMDEAQRVQEKFVEGLGKTLGKVVGYKAGLTNTDVQRRFGINEPVRGVFLEGMLLENDSIVSADFGARPMFEADLMVRVKDAFINEAKTTKEIMDSIDAVIPFVELPDLTFSRDIRLNAPMVVAINVGARLGVMGEPLYGAVGLMERLKDMSVEVLDENSNVIAKGKGSALMGDPVNAIIWLRDSLKKDGKTLKKGDLLSLGSFTDLLPPRRGSKITVRYTGLLKEGSVEVSVGFRE